MKPKEIKAAIVLKKSELELAAYAGKPHHVIRELYLQLKVLQYQLIQAEIEQKKNRQAATQT